MLRPERTTRPTGVANKEQAVADEAPKVRKVGLPKDDRRTNYHSHPCTARSLTVFDLADLRVGRLQALADLQLGHARGERVRYRLLNRQEVVALRGGARREEARHIGRRRSEQARSNS